MISVKKRLDRITSSTNKTVSIYLIYAHDCINVLSTKWYCIHCAQHSNGCFLPLRCQGPVHTIKVEVNPNLVTKCSSSRAGGTVGDRGLLPPPLPKIF